jgi:hypothetical protein
MFTEKIAYNMQVLEARQQRNQITRVNPKATVHDVNATFACMDCEVSFRTLTIYEANLFCY